MTLGWCEMNASGRPRRDGDNHENVEANRPRRDLAPPEPPHNALVPIERSWARDRRMNR